MVSSDSGKNSPVASSVLPAVIKPFERRVSTASAMEYRRLPFYGWPAQRGRYQRGFVAAQGTAPGIGAFLRLSVTDTSFSLRSRVARKCPVRRRRHHISHHAYHAPRHVPRGQHKPVVQSGRHSSVMPPGEQAAVRRRNRKMAYPQIFRAI